MKSVCLIGIGNTLRSDDGVGAVVCEYFQKNHSTQLEVIITHQLDITLVEDIVPFKHVVFVDASSLNDDVVFKKLDLGTPTQSYSHHINATFLSQLSRLLFTAETTFYICAIGINDLSFGENLSSVAQLTATKAISIIEDWLKTIN